MYISFPNLHYDNKLTIHSLIIYIFLIFCIFQIRKLVFPKYVVNDLLGIQRVFFLTKIKYPHTFYISFYFYCCFFFSSYPINFDNFTWQLDIFYFYSLSKNEFNYYFNLSDYSVNLKYYVFNLSLFIFILDFKWSFNSWSFCFSYSIKAFFVYKLK